MALYEEILKSTYGKNKKSGVKADSIGWETEEERLARLLKSAPRKKLKLSSRISKFFRYTLHKR